ncbi:MAG: glycine cleavage system aminomethyltransferase GcvT [Schleiferiaceae bacterium]|jgi:aminomethyltransferase|nr:glycine cleavage system aminomethyltransferase GcvT [Schleiferiaceae bacterium]MDG1313610.1 glycine cleavage system aminomethyltransferase GcvT [Schleiferiaceae bacterium]MDG1917958.1 glycine cleavage system aminomethyltransferase GcvT [Schleiferiaceae bacterium]MDG2110373.1 glycine cleavage system aminomethyltransferase GcvT [Schleiferiaceae bacterium]HBK20012.1 glycine cleavage system aminomethyltransferase GcvT [Cryomorphaceae bacterium]
MSNDLKTTALTHVHEALSAKMVPFAGYSMPVQYNGLKLEHAAVREAAGMFDVSHMGEFFLDGPQALDFLQLVTSNDVSRLLPGKIQYSCMPNAQGGIVDDLLVYCFSAQHFMLVVNASNIEKDWNHLMHYAPQFDVTLRNQSEDYSLLAVQGPNAIPLLQTLTEIDLAAIKYYSFTVDTLAGIDDVIISATGYTGSGGFELYVPNAVAESLWEAIVKAGDSYGLLPAGLGARDTLRLEMGMALYGNDIDDTTSPIEAGLSWITKFTKDFVSCELFQAQKEAGAENKLVGFEMIDRGIPRHDYPIADASGVVIGRVTSGTNSPSTGKNIGMGYVPTALSKEGSTFFVMIRNKPIKAQVVKLPFYKK